MPTRSRREEYSDASRRALIDSARVRFAAQGFGATSLDDIASDARLTNGTVYHHFVLEQALFEAVLSEIEAGTVNRPSAWEAALSGLDAFLDRCLDPAMVGDEREPRDRSDQGPAGRFAS